MSDRPKPILAALLGLQAEEPGEDASAMKRAAFERFKRSLKDDDVDASMEALDDYIAIRDL